ncbi:inositol monophosphatase [Nocardia cyriacigeorgica]|uniref:Inositol-1-monophosphatase n=2 Tax=Nocardia cyriacigeorgica TaxID=135487 RepID=H6R318_NOCCG|nr:inositol monophosphatase [Nocardia cyriacigeorgica]MBF6284719.1 inositol monophosphatase [Nocardia cyriacigeorgica]MBF6423672.1 inositol monophosphatase [Nocardia cyriacigeorgica]NEW31205.1 inositol monophosphatase [Nocardia cyriacigeorgica]CCF64417.1 Inositol-1-monophosphatase (IMPase) (Inositol-1-phosphatase) (I-1-Pase) [Nocardia cyriacigeorgica GUH-2]
MECVPHSPTSPQPTAPTSANSADSAPDAAELRRIAVRLAEAAAAHVRTRRPEVFGPGGSVDGAVQAKSTPTDPVTVVDTETEQLIRTTLARLRPGDHILGEEGGGDLARADDHTVVWVVDPIDGTVNFLYGIPAYAVSVAAMRAGRSIAGAVVDVAAGQTYHAGLGLGAERVDADGTTHPLRCNPVEEVRMALVATGFGYNAARRARQAALVAEVLPRVRDIRRIGAAALDLCMVAEGRVDAHYEHGLNPWDWAAGALIATEAGARVQAPPAHSTGAAGELFVAAAPAIADELLALLDELGVSAPIPEP